MGDTAAVTGVPEKTKKGTELKVLDGKSAQNLSILVGSFKLSYEQIKKKIYQVDDEVITGNALENLLKFLPTQEQMNQLKNFQNEYDDLNEAEKFALQLSGVHRLEQRLNCMKAKLDFEEELISVKPDIANATEACKELRRSTKFAKFLELLLLTGNYMNAGTKNSQAFGFDISLLSKVGNTKSVDGKMTFTHFLAEMVETKFSGIDGFENELSHAAEACRVSDDMTLKAVNSLNAALNRIRNELKHHNTQANPDDKFGDKMSDFLAGAGETFQIVQEMHKKMTSLFSEIVEYFCLDPKKSSLEETFGIIYMFLQEYTNAKKDNVKRREKEEKERKAKEKAESDRKKKEATKQQKNRQIALDASEDDTGVLDGLMAALQTGSAFRDPSRPQRRRQPRKPRAGQSDLERKSTRVNIVPIKMLQPGQKLSDKMNEKEVNEV